MAALVHVAITHGLIRESKLERWLLGNKLFNCFYRNGTTKFFPPPQHIAFLFLFDSQTRFPTATAPIAEPVVRLDS
jgi:hypothetical protein